HLAFTPWRLSAHPLSTSEVCPPSLHDALPISFQACQKQHIAPRAAPDDIYPQASLADNVNYSNEHPNRQDRQERLGDKYRPAPLDRKSTRLNSSHASISYAVFCLKKKRA